MTITENLDARQNQATLPLDSKDPARFSQLTETVKDAFQRELQDFFDYTRTAFQNVKTEIPTIEKYTLGTEAPDKPINTFTRVILKHPDILERLPLVAITTATGGNNKLGFNSQFVSAVQPAAQVKSTNPGPFNLVDGDQIAFRTRPDGVNDQITTIPFLETMVTNLSQTTNTEVVAITQVVALYMSANLVKFSGTNGTIRFSAFGPLANLYPNEIEVLGPPFSTQNALDQLGLVAGTIDRSVDRPPRNRYQLSANLNVGLDIGAESENVRREITDLILNFLSIEMDKRDFTFYGRTVFDDDFVQDSSGRKENYQIILKDQHTLTGEAELPRQAATGEQKDLIYINRVSVPITIIDYIDREVVNPPQRLDQATLLTATSDSELPAGDHSFVEEQGC